jgi:hypothetical protein
MGSVLAVLFVIGVVLWVFTLNPSTTATTAAPAVPALINQTEGVATQTISALGLTPDVEYEANAAVPEGIVIETFPEEGTRVAPGEPVESWSPVVSLVLICPMSATSTSPTQGLSWRSGDSSSSQLSTPTPQALKKGL